MPGKIIAIASSDWHLVHDFRFPSDGEFSLRQVIDLCIEHNVDLLAAGDLLDRVLPDSKTVHVAFEALSRLEKQGLDCYFVQGQHEFAEKSWLDLHNRAHHVHNKSIKIGGISIRGLDYQRSEQINNALEQASKYPADILMTHQVWKEFMSMVGAGSAYLRDVVGFPLIITGDFHSHEVMKIVNKEEKPVKVLSPGSLWSQSVSETPKKFVFGIYDDLSFKSFPIKSRQTFRFVIQSSDDLEKVAKEVSKTALMRQSGVPDDIATPIIDVRFNPDVKDAKIRISEAAKGSIFYARPFKPVFMPKPERLACEEVISRGLQGNLSKLCPEDSITFQLAQRLLLSNSSKDELVRIEKEWSAGTNIKENTNE